MSDVQRGDLALPTMIEIEPTEACNLRCRMCHVSYMEPGPRPFLDVSVIDKLAGLSGAHVTIASGFEPTIHPDFKRMIRRLTDIKCPIQIVTNGTGFNRETIAVMADADVRVLTFSFDGIRKETYEYIRRKSNFEQTVANIRATREAFKGRDTIFSVNNTVMRRNMDELIETADFWDGLGFDALYIIFMVVRYADTELVRESPYPVRDRLYQNLDDLARHAISHRMRLVLGCPYYQRSPLRQEFADNFKDNLVISSPEARLQPDYPRIFQLGRHPGMRFPCKSPWTFAKILPNGQVQLCYKYVVGDLTKESFEDIWFGERAQQVRQAVMRDLNICIACDYYRFCLSNATVNTDDIESYFARSLVGAAHYVDFETGEIHAPTPPPPPRLIESIGQYSVVHYDGRYFGLPAELGPIDLTALDPSDRPGVVVGKSSGAVRRAVRQLQGANSAR